jgi:hypothetical protein
VAEDILMHLIYKYYDDKLGVKLMAERLRSHVRFPASDRVVVSLRRSWHVTETN